MDKKPYADIWGDIVNLHHLAGGLAIGIALGLGSYLLGFNVLKANFPKLPANLLTAYSLLVGIVGCLLAAIISAKLFTPKRVLNQGEFSDEDRLAVLDELQVDREKEKEELKLVDAECVAEMKELQLYDLFTGTPDKSKAVK